MMRTPFFLVALFSWGVNGLQQQQPFQPIRWVKGGAAKRDFTSTSWTFLLDRDGVLNEDVGPPGVIRKEQFRLLPSAANAVLHILLGGHLIRIVTNQSAVRKGLLSAAAVDAIHETMEESLCRDAGGSPALQTLGIEPPLIPLTNIYVATGLDDQLRLKPAPDLLLSAMTSGASDPRCTVVIGDNLTDLRAAAAAKVETAVLVTSSAHGRDAEAALLAAQVSNRGGEDASDEAEAVAGIDLKAVAHARRLLDCSMAIAIAPGLPSAVAALLSDD